MRLFIQIMTPRGPMYVRPDHVIAIGPSRQERKRVDQMTEHRYHVREMLLSSGSRCDILDDVGNLTKLEID